MSQEYLQGLRFSLDTERRRVEELEEEVLRLKRELQAMKVIRADMQPIYPQLGVLTMTSRCTTSCKLCSDAKEEMRVGNLP